MNIDEIRAARLEMENAIFSTTVRAMNDFREKTGMSPRSIDIELHDVTRLYDRENHFHVSNVRATVAL